ncbi:tyrosine-type recombinase/integrase [Allorhizobium ampelinum]|uniref:tyrosine-type recombinase/integrase n=1 Tax=Allorhizobium ampelinum TaxID=3025782 RepID=UPI001F45C6C6|nr:tyrosine-type recombinase/integrase [Allorhizobium ampelinum]
MLSRAETYLAYRRNLGFKLKTAGRQIISFARYADDRGYEGTLSSDIVLRWAKADATIEDPFTWAKRLEVLRPFATFLAAEYGETTFPATNPFGRTKRRLAPHIFTIEEIMAIIAEAHHIRRVQAAGTLMMPALVGLLAATGLRISEALSLQLRDLDFEAAQILVREAKYGRQRLVALHPTSVAALENFIDRRNAIFPSSPTDPVFMSELSGNMLTYMNAWHAWFRITQRLGIRPRGGHPFVRIHDLRHSFICRRLILWQQSGAEIDAAMMMLSTYVGHVNLRDTYWYIESVPELMAIAGNRFEDAATVGGDLDD